MRHDTPPVRRHHHPRERPGNVHLEVPSCAADLNLDKLRIAHRQGTSSHLQPVSPHKINFLTKDPG